MDPNPVTLEEPTSPRGSPASTLRHEYIDAKPFLQDRRDVIEKALKEFDEISKALQVILDDLCKRDTRFDFINAALHELLQGPLGVHDRLGRQLQMIDSALSANHGLDDSDIMIKKKFIAKSYELMKEDPRDHYMLEMAALEILNATVFELLDVFRVEITIQQANTPPDPRSYIQLLHKLHELIMESELELKPEEGNGQGREREKKPLTQAEHEFQYGPTLDKQTDQVRVLKILCGAGDSPVECRLEIGHIHNGDIEEALSYVWGKEKPDKTIQVNQQCFLVTKNLYEILHGLRSQDVIRSIWIDAICINQRNNEEKGHQVRLMRDIYSKAHRTIIWLSTGQQPVVGPDHFYAPFPLNWGGTTVHEHDLASILQEYGKLPEDSCWTAEQLALYTLIGRCAMAVLSHPWWTRIWTLQEGALPSRAPAIFFRGYWFSLDDLAKALRTVKRVSAISHEQRNSRMSLLFNDKGEKAQQVLSQIRKYKDMHLRIPVLPLLLGYRPGLDRNRVPESDTILALLVKTADFQATDPRDKIYALESLLPRCIGRLIRVDYSEHHGSVFKRVTARCCNVFGTFRQAALFPLLLESAKDAPLVPSWVMDFTFSDADERRNHHNFLLVTHEVTLNGFLFHRAKTRLKCMDDYLFNPTFATPTSLFCTGYSVDSISGTGVIEAHGALWAGVDDDFMGLLFFAFKVRDERNQILATRDSPTSNGLTETTISKETLRLMTFFMFSQESDGPQGDFKDLVTTRVNEIRGKTYFITATGLVGIATSPVQKGDSLALLHDAPIYFILRGVGNDEESTGAQKHQIIARAAIDDKALNIQEWIQSFPRRNFHIV